MSLCLLYACTPGHITFATPWDKPGAPIRDMIHINLKLSSILIFEKRNIPKNFNERSVRTVAAKRTEKMRLFAFLVAHGAEVKSVFVKSYYGNSKVCKSLFQNLSRLTESVIVKYNRDFKKPLW